MERLIKVSSACVIGVVITGCAVEPPPVFNPRALQDPERTSATQVKSEPMRALPTTLESPYLAEEAVAEPATKPTTNPTGRGEPVVYMTLQEIVQRSVANSLDVRVAGYGSAIEETRTVEAEARFDPTFFTGVQYEARDRLTGGTLIGDGLTSALQYQYEQNSQTLSGNVGIRKITETGAQVELRHSINHTQSDPAVVLTNPYYESELVLQITQPLLRDFGTEVNRARIEVSRNNQKISLLDFRKALEENVAQIEQIYWELNRANIDVKILEDLLDDTRKTSDILLKRQGQDVTRVQISQTNASLEQRQALLVGARARIGDLSDQLKRLMNDPSLPITSATIILPASAPVEVPIIFDLDDQIETAMGNRFDLAQQQLRVSSSEIVTRVAKNNLLPQLNLVGLFGTQGLSDDIDDSYSAAADYEHLNWGLGLQLEVPIGNRAARAAYHRSRLQQQQAIDQYHAQIEQVALEVKASQREVMTSWDEMRATRQAEFAAKDSLDAIREQEAADAALTPEFVDRKLDAQARYANTRQQSIQSLVSYNVAISTLERSKGTLLRYNNILMSEDDLKKMAEPR